MTVAEFAIAAAKRFGNDKVHLDAYMNPAWNHADPTVQYVYENGAQIAPPNSRAESILTLRPMESYWYSQLVYGLLPSSYNRMRGVRFIHVVAPNHAGQLRESMPMSIEATVGQLHEFSQGCDLFWLCLDEQAGTFVKIDSYRKANIRERRRMNKEVIASLLSGPSASETSEFLQQNSCLLDFMPGFREIVFQLQNSQNDRHDIATALRAWDQYLKSHPGYEHRPICFYCGEEFEQMVNHELVSKYFEMMSKPCDEWATIEKRLFCCHKCKIGLKQSMNES
jgi:hypothetical protein